MNNFFTQLKTIARTNKLSANEKQAMRVRLYNYLEQNPMGSYAAPAPVARPVPSTFYFFSPRYMVPVALLLVVGLSSGTAFAAQGALPGDTLYALKINVNEAVQTALATSPQAKAEINAQLATTRLEEAEALAASGKLNATATAVLASNFTVHAKVAQATTHAIESNDPGTAAQLGADFNSTLEAHGAILTQIGDDSKSDETMQNSNSLAMAVQQETELDGRDDSARIETATLSMVSATTVDASATEVAPQASGANNTRIHTFAAVAPSASSTATATALSAPAPSAKAKGMAVVEQSANPNDAKIAASLATQASTSIAAMAKDFAALKKSLDADTIAQLNAQIATVQTQSAAASAELAAGNVSAAVRDLGAVIRTSIKLDAYFKAGKKINIKLLSGLLTATTSIKGSSGDIKATSVTQTSTTSNNTTTTTTVQSSSSSDNSGKGESISNSSNINVGNSVNIETHN